MGMYVIEYISYLLMKMGPHHSEFSTVVTKIPQRDSLYSIALKSRPSLRLLCKMQGQMCEHLQFKTEQQNKNQVLFYS